MLSLFRRSGRTSPSDSYFQSLAEWSIQKKLFAVLIPAIVCIVAVTGFVLNVFSRNYIEIATERNTILLTLAQARELENLLDGCREDIVALAHQPMSLARLRTFLQASAAGQGHRYVEAAYVGESASQQYIVLNAGDTVEEVPPAVTLQMKNSPLVVPRKVAGLRPGEVTLSSLSGVYYPPTGWNGPHGQYTLSVLRLATPVTDEAGNIAGFLVLSVDGRCLRNLLSLYNSTGSPLHGYARATENRLSLFVDDRGWILFQSEDAALSGRELSVDSARTGLTGDHGRPGYDDAFRPSPKHESFWRMVSAMQQGNAGVERGAPDFGPSKISSSEDFLGYAPVRFRGGGEGAEIIGGVLYIDRSLLPRAAEFGQFNILFATTTGAVLALALLIVVLARAITRPVLRLTEEVAAMRNEGRLHTIDLPDSDRESTTLKQAINNLIAALLSKELEIKARDEHLRTVRDREKVRLAMPAPRPGRAEPLADFVGESPALGRLLDRIRRLASTEDDVLITGETGTGKELTAEAIHRLSRRAAMPFVSINCGALDENLLMDALFGHVRGAYSEAKTDRKGAFVAANGGTLLLDEIGTASPRVQQALLRALSVRRITPLGSDAETAFDARVIAATNVNLKGMVADGTFREDLYYRLQVLSVTTPPLRERLEDVALLSAAFLKQVARRLGRTELSLSRGALDKLMAHTWRGNVRELKNCLIRAAALCERDLILAEGIHFETEAAAGLSLSPDDLPAGPGIESVDTHLPLNARQRRALRALVDLESFTRQDYQDAGGDNLPQRTAQHDLQDLVTRGIVRKQGRGPATRYRLARPLAG